MGGETDNVSVSIAHLVLSAVASRGISKMNGKSFTDPGMHANFFIHGIFGFLHHQSGLFNNDFASLYAVTHHASKYLALPCLMADLYRSKHELSVIHLLSGVVPFAMAVSGKENAPLGNMMIACNIISLIYYSMENKREYGYYAAAAGIFAYFMGHQTGTKVMYPLGLALMEYFAFRLFHIQFDSGPQ